MPVGCLDQVKLAIAKAEFQKMETAGIIRQSDSPWASPLHMVPKPDGFWQPCSDYRCLNNVTRPDPYPLPNICDFKNNLKRCTVFSKIDLVKGYHRVPMSDADIWFEKQGSDISTPHGQDFLRFTLCVHITRCRIGSQSEQETTPRASPCCSGFWNYWCRMV